LTRVKAAGHALSGPSKVKNLETDLGELPVESMSSMFY